MATQRVTTNEQDGRLGSQVSNRLLAIVGPADTGPLNTPLQYSRTRSVINDFTRGALVHAAGYAISRGLSPVLVRSGATTAATEATIDVTGVTGTSVVTYGADTTANDDYELYFKVITGGTIATAGITFQASLDGGRTLGPVTALGTANTYVFPGSGGVGFAFAAGTLVAGDVVRGYTTGPVYNSTDIGSALGALANSSYPFEIVEMCGSLDATLFAAVETAFGSGIMPRKMWVGHYRMPNVGETEAAYLTAYKGVFDALATTHGLVCAADCEVTSGADFLSYRRPPSHAVAPLLASVDPHIDISDTDLGSLPGVNIKDSNGNPLHHDERLNGGLSDARACVLTTVDEIQGVYVNDPVLLSAAGSDFVYAQHRRVMNIARNVLQVYFRRVLSKPIPVNAKGTRAGKITEAAASRIERGASNAVAAALMAKPMASGGGFDTDPPFVHVSRDDLLLTTKTLTAQCSIVPLSYPKAISLDIGFTNPALQLKSV